ncbi:MAG: hypothetical protein LBJ64_10170 [Deltaproteobacteria bacterium]|jgi:hypothetical protein|nr:hypothetical protein [Deltaproteobacteria bacterium]
MALEKALGLYYNYRCNGSFISFGILFRLILGVLATLSFVSRFSPGHGHGDQPGRLKAPFCFIAAFTRRSPKNKRGAISSKPKKPVRQASKRFRSKLALVGHFLDFGLFRLFVFSRSSTLFWSIVSSGASSLQEQRLLRIMA